MLFQIPQRYRFSSKSQRLLQTVLLTVSCFRYHKGTDFQANHNSKRVKQTVMKVVLDTTKVQIFKQITTLMTSVNLSVMLFQIPQRYRFSSKSQHTLSDEDNDSVVLDTTKVQIFKQITTRFPFGQIRYGLFQIPQRYRFSSKSQRLSEDLNEILGCFRYHKGTDFQANHNTWCKFLYLVLVVLDTTKVQIFKQITT